MRTVLPLLAEYLGTFLLTLSYLAIPNPFAIASIFLVTLLLIIPVSGASINPAITISMYLYGKLGLNEAMLYIAMEVFAGLTAFYLFKIIE